MHAQRMIRVLAALLLSASICHGQQASTVSSSFSFTQVDLDLLKKSDQLDKQFQERGLVFDDGETTRYLTKVGQAVLPQGPVIQDIHWQFFILRDPTPNSFALPNGSIYVASGLLAVIENEAQLAGVLAHEETHVLNRHGYLENRNYRKKAETGMILVGATSMGGFAGGISGAASLLLVQLAMPSILAATINGYSRGLEEEADLRAVHALVESGYSAGEMKNLFDALQQDHDVDLSKKCFYQDHPKLQDRSQYVSKLAASLQPQTASPEIERIRYLIETESAIRHDAELEILDGRARTAVWEMEHIVKSDDKLAENFYVLGEAYRGLGPLAPEPSPSELTEKRKVETRKMMATMTPKVYERALLKAPGGPQTLQLNQQMAEKNYRKALEISPNLAGPHEGLGFLYEKEQKPEQSAQEFRTYLDLAPSALDSPQIRRRLAAMEKEAAIPRLTPGGK